ncbi:hypothetical protein PRIPAC_75739 [Pristionchus pacificus]|uniref:SANT domain-containing protein n=1 Tax=Pristionchus pacificus TaxID=54126 RepID=A0A2A6BFA3_PRIPA|nr:hypothetical protein PRIPAC_75739 [Pristionchus pacificus]|eukprot:PDM64564.1 hypothetical protein PRIPAC_52820 [Pristionchus pacificus]
MSVEIDVELQGVVRKTINAIRLCEVNRASKAFIKLSPAEMTMILRHLLPPKVLSKMMDSSKKNFHCVAKPHAPIEQLGRTLRKRRANEDADFDIITFKRVKVTEEEEEKDITAPVAEVKDENKEEKEEDKSEVSAIEIEAETSDPKAVEVKTTDEVEEVKSEETKEAAISERNQLEYFDQKKGWKVREMEIRQFNREDEEEREEPLQIEFEGRFRDEVKEFTHDEKLLFEYGFTKLKKDFRAIRDQYLPEKSVGDIVGFYYRWKTSSEIYECFKPSLAEKTFAKAEKAAKENQEGRKKRKSSYLNKDLLAKMEELASGVAKRKVEKKTEKISLKKIEKAEEKDKSLKTVKAVKKQMMGKIRGRYKKRANFCPSKKVKKMNKE